MTALEADYGNATIRRVQAPIPGAESDPALRAWNRNRSVPRERLIRAAQLKIGRLLSLPTGWDAHRARPATPLAAAVLNGVLNVLLADDSATPQIAPLPTGGVQVEWLVACDSLQIDISPAGEVTLVATDSSGGDVMEGQFVYYEPDVILLDQARAFLEKISDHVEVRVTSA